MNLGADILISALSKLNCFQILKEKCLYAYSTCSIYLKRNRIGKSQVVLFMDIDAQILSEILLI